MNHHQHDHDEHIDDGIPHVSAREYLTGFVMAVVLTAIPFGLVMTNVVHGSTAIAGVLLLFAAVQVVVHMVYFLHMNTKSEGGWNALALIFTVVLVIIVLTGSMWVMHHMNANMMPGMHDMQDMLGGGAGSTGPASPTP
ncbi:cytochrome o ubiquinol oxidase subunit IV [Pseudoxanthomonas dokdonensis]|uniref:Cytochrome bo(3) ubiquinol oxidase subunit 4 n=1 Tax=Pseudoxanthomonas dokdonensis TaxID=344882 RepID=A0A0R0CKI2_9GAMM|nr:cytochrome o ubiquinol oxidase subunit IV [Pseudoxanthomonas dokdonensis]KRG70509.1 hypothetical protein ABB29_05360 [Pseudoxanthomonas dokdonensis]